MEKTLIAALFALLGGVAGFMVSKMLISDRIKELLYKEKLTLYKRLSFELWELINSCYDYMNSYIEARELEQKISAIEYLIHCERLLVPDDIFDECIDFLNTIGGVKRSQEPWQTKRFIEGLRNRWQEIANSLRKQLGIHTMGRVTTAEGIEWLKRSLSGGSEEVPPH